MSGSFSSKLSLLAKSKQRQSIGFLINMFEDKSFATLFIVLMAFSAFPVPTGGLTNIFELITIILSVQMIAGRHSIWLPKRLTRRELTPQFLNKTIPVIIRWYKKIERYSRPRFVNLINTGWFQRLNGLAILVFAIGALISPPFTNLETLPALGIIIMSIALILDDLIITIVGFLVGSAGIALIFMLGSLAFSLF